ncbi:MAG TPA: farnesyl diphosphate synthase [Sedimentisphaerales bacterium]|nr:farnesyl diphosphate synthase [Sedimentisphaerales bacterium]
MTSRTSTVDFGTQLRRKAQRVNYTLRRILELPQMPDELKKPLKYTLDAPGKRVRPALVLWCCELISGQVNHNAEIASAAIELVHTYSLVHDDLPAMDNDDFRRGQATCHKAFDEQTAILTGDALLTLAFEVLAKEIDAPDVAVRLIAQLAQDAGVSGMIAGQMADLKAQQSTGTKELVEYIHINKTAKMFRCAAAMGAICGGATQKQFEGLCEYGLHIGLAFQIADDILDVTASSEQLGKTAGKDLKAAKCTYPAVVGLEKAKASQKKLTAGAVAELEPFGDKAETLRQFAQAMLERTK